MLVGVQMIFCLAPILPLPPPKKIPYVLSLPNLISEYASDHGADGGRELLRPGAGRAARRGWSLELAGPARTFPATQGIRWGGKGL